MNDNHNIDNLLKETFDGFNPEPPAEIWQLIQQQLPVAGNTPLNSQPTNQPVDFISNSVKFIKSLSVTTKVVSTVVALVSSTTVIYFAFKDISNKPQQTTQQPAIENIYTEPTPINENIRQEENIIPETKYNNQNKPIKKQNKQNQSYNSELNDLVQPETTNLRNDVDKIQETNILKTDDAKINIQSNSNQSKSNPERQSQLVDIEIEEEQKPKVPDEDEIKIPNVFTPNGDGKNDYFIIKFPQVSNYHLVIFSIKNEIVFETNDLNDNWDGKHYKSGVECDAGTYHFVLQYTKTGTINNEIKKGFIKLIR